MPCAPVPGGVGAPEIAPCGMWVLLPEILSSSEITRPGCPGGAIGTPEIWDGGIGCDGDACDDGDACPDDGRGGALGGGVPTETGGATGRGFLLL